MDLKTKLRKEIANKLIYKSKYAALSYCGSTLTVVNIIGKPRIKIIIDDKIQISVNMIQEATKFSGAGWSSMTFKSGGLNDPNTDVDVIVDRCIRSLDMIYAACKLADEINIY